MTADLHVAHARYDAENRRLLSQVRREGRAFAVAVAVGALVWAVVAWAVWRLL